MTDTETNHTNLNKEKRVILERICSQPNRNFFITGNAGTGKSLLLRHLRHTLKKELHKSVLVAAPTGIAAFNVSGRTIHSAFGFPFGILTPQAIKQKKHLRKIRDLAKEIDVLIIDEISMVRADLFYVIDVFLQKARSSDKPFGGVQVILFGDIMQLPPVLTPKEKDAFNTCYEGQYFFSAPSYEESNFEFFHLTENFRQSDDNRFLEILNRIRDGAFNSADLKDINSRVYHSINKDAVTLVPTNEISKNINQERLKELPGAPKTYIAEMSGKYNRTIPAEKELILKVGARVMLLFNLTKNLVNGSMGTVTKLDDEMVGVKFDNETFEYIKKNEWTINKSPVDDGEDQMNLDFEFDESTTESYNTKSYNDGQELDSVGSYTQIPLILAWATTIHKSQGKTFDKVNINWGNGAFAHGQAYVALSRCTSLEGIILLNQMRLTDIRIDPEVTDFLKSQDSSC